MTIPRPVTVVKAVKVRPDRWVELPEHVTTEEPLQIQVAGPGQAPAPVAVTMRTPGHDFELAAGFLVSEGIAGRQGIRSVGYCDADRSAPARFNTVTVVIDAPWEPDGPARRFSVSTSCGICGKAAIDQVEVTCPVVGAAPPLPAGLITALPARLRSDQKTFERTGGLHAAGLFDAEGRAWCIREDIGRHNAVDKVIGYTVLAGGLPPQGVEGLAGWVLMVSGRVSFEIIQKAAQAGVGTVAAVSAPSSLAVEAAGRLGVTLLAFVRGDTFNVYSHPERVELSTAGQGRVASNRTEPAAPAAGSRPDR
jgi:FdhD protein